MNKTEDSTSSPPTNETVQEYTIRISKNLDKKHHIMSFNGDVNFNRWYNVKMHRESNKEEHPAVKAKMPKFGAGSEYNHEFRENMRRGKCRSIPQNNKPDDQPWLLKVGVKAEKHYRGRRKGGVNDYTSYYVLTKNSDDSFEASPLNEWYEFQPVQRYKTLSAEEAEKAFGQRNKIVNYFSLMMQNRLHDAAEKEAKSKSGKELTLCDDEDVFMDTDDESDSEAEGKYNGRKACTKGKITKTTTKGEKRKRTSDSDNDDVVVESDDGDKESHEMDYGEPSESEESDFEKIDNESMANEDGLHKLSSDEESAEEDLQ